MRKIPIYVSCPTDLNAEQERKREIIVDILNELQMEPRALGRSDYPFEYPLKEVYVLAKHCSGGVILGFGQIYITSGIKKRGVVNKEQAVTNISIPTAWNHLEAGILFGLKLPILIFKEDTIEGGVFDLGTTDVFVNGMPPDKPSKEKINELKDGFLKWHGSVISKYYEY